MQTRKVTPYPSGSALSQLWKSPWTRWVGFRYLKSKKSSRFLSFITILSILGVGLGVTALIVVLSVMEGFENELKKRLTASDLHVLVTPSTKVPGFEPGGYVPKRSLDLRGLLSVPAELWPVLSTEVILKHGKQVKGVVLKGIDQKRLKRLKGQIVETADPQMLVVRDGPRVKRYPGVFVGKELAYEMSFIPGDFLTIISPTETQGPLVSVPKLRRFVIEGVYESGLPDQELYTLFARHKAVESFLRKKDVVTQWEISTPRFEDATQVAKEIRLVAPEFEVKDWIQMNASLFSSLKLERVAMFLVLIIIIVVASFNIVTTLTLLVLEKKKEISILKAMGARKNQVAAIFLGEGLMIGLSGVIGGSILAFVLSSLLQRYEFIQLPDIYYDRTLPVSFVPAYYGLVGVAAFLIVLAACLYPSRRAAKLHPLEGIRS